MPARSELLTLNFYLPILLNAIRTGFIWYSPTIGTPAAGRLLRTLRKCSVKMIAHEECTQRTVPDD
jgi:hypothetical protein